MATHKQRLYRVSFHNRGQVYEIYAREVSHAAMLGFVEVGKLAFGEKSSVVLDPGEEKLKNEFENVERFYVPVHAVIRIDEVSKQGAARIHAGGGELPKTPVYNLSDYKK
jgi:hypothetical protein